MTGKRDSQLGMHTPIARRDFIHGVAMTAVGASLSPLAAGAPATGSYPPVLTGLRGSHPGAYEVAHGLARENRTFPEPRALSESYDLIVVGAGLSGLAAAHYYQQRFGPKSRILLLDNHDDFGGHARRNEFHQGGVMRLALGGTHNLEHWEFSRTVRALMKDLGIDVHALVDKMSFQYGRNGKRGRAIWFDEATYGENRLVDNYTLEEWWPGKSLDCIDQFPVSRAAKSELRRLFEVRKDLFAGQSQQKIGEQLAAMSYPDFLRRYGGWARKRCSSSRPVLTRAGVLRSEPFLPAKHWKTACRAWGCWGCRLRPMTLAIRLPCFLMATPAWPDYWCTN